MKPTLVLGTLLVAVVSACSSGSGQVQGDLLVTADRLFDGERLIENGAVLVDGRTIVAVGPRDDVDARAERTLDLGAATVMPGLIDLHVHRFGEGMLLGGVTTVRDLGSWLAALPPPPARPGHPRVLAAGPIMTVSGGYPGTVHDPRVGLPVRGPAGAREAVADLVRRGAAVIKISLEPGGSRDWPMLSLEEVRAIVLEAHRRNRIVTAHVSDSRGVRRALAADVDEFAHMPCEAGAALMREVAEHEVEIVATLHVRSRCPGAVANARAFVAAGGSLLYGSDYGNPGIPLGIDVDELKLMTRAGLTTGEALAAATSKAGRQLGLRPLGSLVRGAPADLIAVHGDPFADLGALDRLDLIVVGGAVVLERGRVNLPVQ